jgi:hypothetical protein
MEREKNDDKPYKLSKPHKHFIKKGHESCVF